MAENENEKSAAPADEPTGEVWQAVFDASSSAFLVVINRDRVIVLANGMAQRSLDAQAGESLATCLHPEDEAVLRERALGRGGRGRVGDYPSARSIRRMAFLGAGGAGGERRCAAPLLSAPVR